jgi:uncharacterized protein (DUF1501 family)
MSAPPPLTRRAFLAHAGSGVATAALASMLPASARGQGHGVVTQPHVRPRARRVVHLCMAGGPSHLETLDWKPELAAMHGEPMPESLTQGQQLAQLQGQALRCLGPQHPFARYGASGQRMCTLFPHIGRLADDLCVVRSMTTTQINHDPAHTLMNTGSGLSGRPGMGAWFNYGLGTEARDLPGYVVLTSVGKGGQAQPIASRQWSAGFLPGRFQGVHFNASGAPVHHLESPAGVDRARQADVIGAARALDSLDLERALDPALATRIAQYEMAFRMQASVPELTDLSGESEEVFELYGTRGADGTYAANCLLARRMLERGVRFVQLYHRAWDHHGGIRRSMQITAEEVDRATFALVHDLARRGLLEDTLVVWGGEFGRTPMGQGDGRDHHIKGFSIWLAGGGVRGGHSHGSTDELGYAAVEDVATVHDLHATMLHLLGIDHERLIFRFQGRDYRLTDVHGEVVRGWLA